MYKVIKDWFAEYFGRYNARMIKLPEKFFPKREFLEFSLEAVNAER